MMIGLTELRDEHPAEKPGNAATAVGFGAGESVLPAVPLMTWADTLTPSLVTVLETFWERPMTARLFSCSDRQLYFWRPDDFYVSQLDLEAGSEVGTESAQASSHLELRLSDALCETFFTKILGQAPAKTGFSGKPTPFSFQWMSPLEQELLQGLTTQVLRWAAGSLLKKGQPSQSARRSLRQQAPPTVYLVWLVTLAETSPDKPAAAGKIILSLPLPALAWEPQETDEQVQGSPKPARIADSTLKEALGTVTLSVGRARASLTDLRALAPGDWVVLEDSHIQQMAVLTPEGPVTFPIQMEGDALTRLQKDGPQEVSMSQSPSPSSPSTSSAPREGARPALWDTLMIDVHAEFEPLQLPLRQIRDMTRGVVVTVGDLLNTPVQLRLDHEVLATGSLVIVGDQFGVRVDEIHAQAEAAPAGPLPQQVQQTPQQQPAQTAQATPAAQAQPAGQSAEQAEQQNLQQPSPPADQPAPDTAQAEGSAGDEELFGEDLDSDNFDEDDW